MRLLVVSLAFDGLVLFNHTYSTLCLSPPIMFQDFRNYHYSLPIVPGLTVDLEARRTRIKIPITGYNEVRLMPH